MPSRAESSSCPERPSVSGWAGILLCFAAPLLASPLAAAEQTPGEWTSLGPPGATATAFAQATEPADTVYVGVRNGGVFRSDDGGRTWIPARDGLFAREVHDLATDPQSPSTLLAGTERGVYRTEDEGASWTLHADGLPADSQRPVRALAIDPDDPRVVWAGAGAGVWRSGDGGRTWSDTGENPGGTAVLELALDPSADGVLFAGTNHGIFRSEDAGRTWVRAGESTAPELELRNSVNELVIDPSAPGILYVALHGPGPSLAKSDDGGATWTPIVEGLPLEGQSPTAGWALALDPTRPDTLYAAGDRGIFRRVGDGDGWTLLTGDADVFDRDAFSLAALVTRNGAVLAGTAEPFTRRLGFGTGLVRSADGLSNWGMVASGLTALAVDEVVPDPHADGVLYTLRTDGRLLRSEDAGETWTPADRGIPAAIEDVVADPVRPGVLYATATGSAPFFRSADRGRSWEPAGAGLPASAPRISVLPPPAGGGAPTLIIGPVEDAFYRSTDGGTTFEVAGETLIEGGTDLISSEIESAPSGTLYVWGTARLPLSTCPGMPSVCELGPRLYRSTDAGESWTELETPDARGTLGPFAADPQDASTLYFFVGESLFRSGDHGQSWTEIAQPPEAEEPAPWERLPDERDLLADPGRPGFLYLSSSRDGLLQSTDGGRTWERRNRGLASPSLGALAFRSGPAGDTLFAASPGGAWAVPLGTPPPPPPAGPSFVSSEVPGFRVWVRITAGDGSTPAVRKESRCIPETLCVSGAVPGRSEVFVRIVGPKPNGRLWPTLVKFSTSRVEVWIEQVASGEVEYYRLEGAQPGVDELPGLFDRRGFEP